MLQWRNRSTLFYVQTIILTVAFTIVMIGWGPPPWLLWSMIVTGIVSVGALLYAWYTRKPDQP